MVFLSSKIEDSHLDTFIALSDGLVHETSIDNIKDSIDPEFPEDKLREYVESFTRPSNIPEFKDAVLQTLNKNSSESAKMFTFVMNLLDSRIMAPMVSGSTTLIRDMTLEQREKLLASWRDSNIALRRKLFRSVYAITIATYTRLANDLHLQAVGYPGRELRDTAYEKQVVDDFRYDFMEKPTADGQELYLPYIDAIIIGSGCGAGAVAHTLSENGFKSLILEKGKYFSNSEFNFDDLDGVTNLFEGGGTISTTDQETFILAGSNFGGGSTVNWSASLKTPFKVRKEWYDDFGLEFVASEVYDKCQQYVCDKMHVGTDKIKHSFANQVIMEGGAKLGYAVKAIDQNTAGQEHPCGFCHVGCKFGIKQSTPNNWFREAAVTGSKFMEQVKVVQILHSKGIANGVLCQDTVTGVKFKITGPRKYIVSGGSLNTPVILQNSGFKNRHIGKNLKLHPVSVLTGDFGNDVRAKPYENSIMTSVCTEVDDLDGKAHGAKIETVLNAPFLQQAFLPWFSSDETRRSMLRYNNMVSLLLITRDKSSGSIRADPDRPDAFIIDYHVNKFDRHALMVALLTAADMLYIQGAKKIITPLPNVPIFESDKLKYKRSIEDVDYVEWRAAVSKMKFYPYGTSFGTAHQMASCRMSGKGPKYGACDERGRLFECSNVYVADASIMPTASGANPMITTYALSRYVGLNIVKDLTTKAKL
ncbi:fatty alcohol oxidase [Spathaspora passalidarum NRRL Y-27907]|uniref:Long-chain-alcohol oxidase n=1 Tax=Spathaspora passalidarum (strain NRRL Y-27907 / 11-Y1) TaxID=619300 RepID=G3AJP0_SPAPN|nr:fatty alcohol oxidase [Spathaspora passalidarum NRRL Y-27907]EGW33941.1 fatty alcohol oxidase [Spathaspora passalidarum NRRL Y-27907]